MKALLYLDAVLTAFGAVMTIVLGVVCLLFGIYHDAMPSIGRDLPHLLIVTIAFALLMAAAAAATVCLWRRHRWRWLAQAALVVVIPVTVILIRRGVQSG